MLDGKAYNVNRLPPINKYEQVRGSVMDTTIII